MPVINGKTMSKLSYYEGFILTGLFPQTSDEIQEFFKKRHKLRLLWWLPLAAFQFILFFDILMQIQLLQDLNLPTRYGYTFPAKALLFIVIGLCLFGFRPTVDNVVQRYGNSNDEKKRLLAETYNLLKHKEDVENKKQHKDSFEKIRQLNKELKDNKINSD